MHGDTARMRENSLRGLISLQINRDMSQIDMSRGNISQYIFQWGEKKKSFGVPWTLSPLFATLPL